MKILLVACNAKYIHSNLAVYDLQAYASDYADHIVLKEYTINQQKDDIMRDIYLEHPDVVCVSCYIWNLSFVKELMADLIKILPGADFWAGGPEVSYDAEKFLTENSEFKGVMVGEGEETFKELAGYYVEKNPQDLKDMTGICYRDGDQIIHNGWRQIMDLSSIPFIYKDLSEFKNRIIYYESSRGCPFSCAYCLSSIDKKLRFRDTETVKKELQFFIDNKVPQVKFVDRTFNCKHDHAMAIWKYIQEHDNGIDRQNLRLGNPHVIGSEHDAEEREKDTVGAPVHVIRRGPVHLWGFNDVPQDDGGKILGCGKKGYRQDQHEITALNHGGGNPVVTAFPVAARNDDLCAKAEAECQHEHGHVIHAAQSACSQRHVSHAPQEDGIRQADHMLNDQADHEGV